MVEFKNDNRPLAKPAKTALKNYEKLLAQKFEHILSKPEPEVKPPPSLDREPWRDVTISAEKEVTLQSLYDTLKNGESIASNLIVLEEEKITVTSIGSISLSGKDIAIKYRGALGRKLVLAVKFAVE